MSALPILPAIRVQTSTDLSGWTDRAGCWPEGPLIERLAPAIGGGQLVEQLTVDEAYEADGTPYSNRSAIAAGTYVRVVRDSDNTPYWHGVIGTHHDDRRALRRTYECHEIGWVLDQYRIGTGYVVEAQETPTATVAMDDWPTFNAHGVGNKSAATLPYADTGISGHAIHPGSGTFWSAQAVTEVLLKSLQADTGVSPTWALSVSADATTAGDRTAVWDLAGLSLWQALDRLWSGWAPWRVTVSGSSITIQAGGSTDRSPSYGLEVQVLPPRYRPVAPLRYDDIEVRLATPPACTLTLYAQDAQDDQDTVTAGSLVPSWTAAEQTEWDATPDDPALAHVWRQWRIAPDWDGATWTDSTDSDGLRGSSGAAQARDHASLAMPSVALLEVLPHLMGADNDGNPVVKPPLVYIGDATVGSDISGACDVILQHDAKGPLITIDYRPGSSDGRAILRASLLDDAQWLQLTIAIREPTAKRARYAAGSSPRVPRRRVVHVVPGRQWYVASGAVLPADVIGGGSIVMDEVDCDALLTAVRSARYDLPAAAQMIEWTILSDLDPDADLGDTVSSWSGADVSLATVATTVVERAWLLADDRWGISYRTDRLPLAGAGADL